ncbi:sulfatase [Alteromonas sp. KUL49]|uniref:sulfatase family protein n=1 Tax=Alteromonas sp. KUL49 TaxID=2480798 RepID=UPI001F5F72D4|nr:sulfatase [Alteromonas sp. KUL49]
MTSNVDRLNALLGKLALVSTLLLTSCAVDTESNHQTTTDKVETFNSINGKPNLIVIVADQMRRSSMEFWQQPEFQGALNTNSDPVITPNLNALADNGVVFTDAIANFPLCSPYRGMLLSGLFPHKNGVTNNTRVGRPEVGLKPDIPTLTSVLRDNGYNTALIGKGHWHNNLPMFDGNNRFVGTTTAPGGHYFQGTRYDTYIPPGKARQGIEYWYQSLGHNHKNPVVYTNDTELSGVEEGTPFHPKRYSAVDQANVIIDYIGNTRAQRDNNKPFAILWTMDPPHSPYNNISDTDERIFNTMYREIPLGLLLNRPNASIERAKAAAAIHFSMITLIDREIGRVLTTLEERNLLNNTLIVFTADHGEMMGSHGKMAKNVYYEESIGIPLILYFPDKLIPQQDDLLIGVPDIKPTVLGLLGLEHQVPTDLDGTNYAPYWQNSSNIDNEPERPKSSLYYGTGDAYGVRTHEYLYVVNSDGNLDALFNNVEDPYQLSPLTLKDIPPEDVTTLQDELGQWLTRINHPWALARKHSQMISYPEE